MEWGPFLKTLEQQSKKGLPTALDSRPVLPWNFSLWVRDFNRLSFSRTTGFSSYNPIDMPSLISYAQGVGVKEYRLQEFIDVIQYVDSIFLAHHAKKAEQQSKK